MKKKLLFFAGFSIAILLFILFKNNFFSHENININQPTKQIGITPKKYEQSISIAAVGDILIHDRVYKDARNNHHKYDFKPMLKNVKDQLHQPDLLMANQETIVAGESIGLSSYPSFNSPHEIADAIKDAGVNIVTTANNHALDRGADAQFKSLTYLRKIKLPYVGTFLNKKDQQTIRVLERNGVKVAFLSYTYGTNGIPIPENKKFMINIIDKQKMKKEISTAKQKADIIVMGIHWGIEYQRFPSKEQEDLAQFLVDQGVNIVFGGHPHVLQPMKWLYNKQGEKALVVYSLGNFLSGQDEAYRNIGGMASVKVKKSIENGKTNIQLENPSFYPTYAFSHQDKDYKLFPLKEAEQAGLKNAHNVYKETMDHMLGKLK
ncbi:CapA family protein [Niallia sp. 03133]|uniref:CapA family protein n=1 Tax=Niallia sp. 03133 TaxID=3458060 RepID=UPI00404458DD